MGRSIKDMIADMRSGDQRSLARMITAVENRTQGWVDIMKAVYPLAGSACVMGITGSPGAGKSTLTNRIAKDLVEAGMKVGIIAVDPSSPFTGGALLGDRLRMRDICTLDHVFIRSMATRGVLGGLCQAARDVTRILDASGKDVVLIETVGVGQDEIEVVRASDFVVLVTFPGQGDGIQVIKAGTMEIADLFVVNKADRDGADELLSEICAMLELSCSVRGEIPGVVKTSCITSEGIDDLMKLIYGFVARKRKEPGPAGEHVREEILDLMEREIFRTVRKSFLNNDALARGIDRIVKGKTDPYSVSFELIQAFLMQDEDISRGGTRHG
ncbi:MAG: methylmalonyl Co-A mutase-associated GTPase MeaB [Deltaproteobacteria bacterium]|nr:methylmalonyl Co-A mutase-associated GTPase MeaB [Deltaproteobacteria bacterium]